MGGSKAMREIIELAKLINVCGHVLGRKKLQKIVFILQAEDYEFPQEFGYLHYGPYSVEVRQGLDLLVANDLISEEQELDGDYPPYEYRPSDRLGEFLSRFEDAPTEPPSWSERAIELNKRSPKELESLATVVFLMQRDFKGGRLEERFKRLKPNLANFFENVLPDAKRVCGVE